MYSTHHFYQFRSWLATSFTFMLFLTVLLLFSVTQTRAQSRDGWIPLFNGQNLDGWYSFLPSTGINNDPKGVFKVNDGMLHILDVPVTDENQEFGYVATNKEYSNYRLRFQYKWGQKKFPPRAEEKRDSGLLYHLLGPDQVWPGSVECQVQEGDTGDFWLIQGTNLTTTVESLFDIPRKYQAGGTLYATENSGYENIIKSGTYDSLTDWNTVEVVISGDDAVHIVNGAVNNRGTDLRQFAPEQVFLSDLPWITTSNGLGLVERDRSNGEAADNDGGTITLNNQTYAKGVGMHSFENGQPAQLVVNLAGNYTVFVADVGVDDEVGSNGSVTFEVWADNQKIGETGVLTGEMGAQPLMVDVAGKQQLHLIVTNGGDSFAYDHASWGNARLLPRPGAQVPLTKGRLLLQAEGAEVFYRNIEIKPLSYQEPPVNSLRLFEGVSTSQWRRRGNNTDPIAWPVTADGELEVLPGGGDVVTVSTFQDFRLHLEFRVPATAAGTAEQDRGNSGVYLQGRYEVQVLDSFGSELSGENDAGAIYGVKNADVNASLPAETWQAYDIVFRAARWTGNTKIENARVSVWWNGILIHDNVEIPVNTFGGDAEGPEPGPILLQDHGNPVRYRNIWLQSNLLINPSFEQGFAPWEDWGNSAVVENPNAPNGSNELRIGTGAGGSAQTVSAEANTTYLLSGWGRVSSGETGWIGVHYLDSAGNQIAPQSLVEFTNTTYEQKQLTLQTPSNTASLRVWVWKNEGVGYFFADDLSLTR